MKKKLLSLLLALAMILPMSLVTMASAKANTLSENTTVSDELTIAEGETLTVPEGVTLTLASGATLNVKGTLDLKGTVKVQKGARVCGNLYGMNKKLVGTKADLGTKNAPVIAISEGSLTLMPNKIIFALGLYQIARNANFPDDVLWKLRHEVFLEYLDNIAVNVKIKGPRQDTDAGKYSYAKLQMHDGATNSKLKVKSGKIYWWLRSKTDGKSSWMYFDYAALFEIKHIIPNIIDDPTYLKAAALAEPNWSECMSVNNTAATEPNWSKKDGTRINDIVYDDSREDENKFDLFIPKSAKKGTAPGVLLFIHGGGWSDGEKSDMAYLCKRFARQGFITASLDYRLFPSNVSYMLGTRTDLTMDDLMDDVNNCIAKMKEVIEENGYKAEKLGLCGYSAGGHMSLLYAYRDAKKSAIPVKCVFSMCGPVDMHIDTYSGVDWPNDLPMGKGGYIGMYTGLEREVMENPTGEAEEWVEHLSPAYQITPNSVPTLALYGDYDRTIGLGHAPMLINTLRKNGVTYEYYEAKKSDHPLELDQQTIKDFMAAAVRYANTYLK